MINEPIPTKQQILDQIEGTAKALGMEDHTALLVKQCDVESSFNPAAHNINSDCYGLFQLSAPTAGDLSVNRLQWKENIYGGVKYMHQLLGRYKGDYAKALAAYNWGLGNLDRLVGTHQTTWRSYLPRETAKYLEKIMPDGNHA